MLIEAVENHMPQVIVIDEIGTKLEAIAASTIAERGIQLVATAHGATIENLIKNPSLDLLVGGVQVRHDMFAYRPNPIPYIYWRFSLTIYEYLLPMLILA